MITVSHHHPHSYWYHHPIPRQQLNYTSHILVYIRARQSRVTNLLIYQCVSSGVPVTVIFLSSRSVKYNLTLFHLKTEFDYCTVQEKIGGIFCYYRYRSIVKLVFFGGGFDTVQGVVPLLYSKAKHTTYSSLATMRSKSGKHKPVLGYFLGIRERNAAEIEGGCNRISLMF